MRKDVKLNILEVLSTFIPDSTEELVTFLLAHTSQKVWNKNKLKLKKIRENKYYNLLEAKRLSRTISKLKNQGAISLQEDGSIVLTDKGKNQLEKLGRSRIVNFTRSEYKKEKLGGDKFCIILFDIKERDRHLRNWLRSVLKNLDYCTLQQSVMVGKTKLPQELIHEFEKQKILHCLHIFTVTKTESGTLEDDSIINLLR